MKTMPIFNGLKLNSDGSEIVDTTKLSVGLTFRGKSAEQKLKEMLQRELERARELEETNLDDFDFELPDDSPQLHNSVVINPISKAELTHELKKQKQKKVTADEVPVSSKSATTDRAKRVETKHKDASASETPTDEEGAEE